MVFHLSFEDENVDVYNKILVNNHKSMKFMLFDRVFIYYKYARFDFPVSNHDKKNTSSCYH